MNSFTGFGSHKIRMGGALEEYLESEAKKKKSPENVSPDPQKEEKITKNKKASTKNDQ